MIEHSTDLVTITKYAEISGWKASAVRNNIKDNAWENGKEYYKTGPYRQSRIFVSISGVEQWVRKQAHIHMPKREKQQSGYCSKVKKGKPEFVRL